MGTVDRQIFMEIARAPGKTVWKDNDSFYKQNPITHERTPSCQVTWKDGRIFFHDWGGNGISFKEFCDALGISYEDAIGRTELKKKRTLVERLGWAYRNIFGEGTKVTIYDYTDEHYHYLYSRVRFQGGSKQEGKKTFLYFRIDYLNDSWVKCKAGTETEVKEHVLYHLPKLMQALEAGRTVYIAEGEKDVHTLESLGYAATCAGASGDWKPEYGRVFKGARLVICPDNDTSGTDYLNAIKRSVKWYAHSVKTVYTCKREHGDITDYIQDGNTAENFEALVEEAEAEYAPWIDVTTGKTKVSLKINTDNLARAVLRNEPYLMNRNPFDEKDGFYFYDGKVYQRVNKNGIKGLIKSYLPCGIATDNALTSTASLMLAAVSPDRVMSSDQLDSDENIVAVRNGIYNIHTQKLEPFSPMRFITRTLDCSYSEGIGEPKQFLDFIGKLCTRSSGEVDTDCVSVLQEFIGLALSNIPGYRIKKALMLVGAGNTGKSVFLNLLILLMGATNVCNIAIRDMNQEGRFSVGSALGKRMIAIGDESSAEIKDTAIFKQLTGGDLIKFEEKGKQPIYHRFGGVIVLAVNNLPGISDDKGSHLFERFLMIPCINVIPENERDPFLLEKLLGERDQIFAWAMEGLHRLLSNGFRFTNCKASEEVSAEYRAKLDSIYRFISEEGYDITGDKADAISKAEFEDAYIEWCQRNDYTPVNKRNIKDRLLGLGVTTAKGNIGDQRAIMIYRKIKKSERFLDDTADEGGLVFG